MTAPGLVALLCAAEILGMTSFGTFAALLPGFRAEWSLSNAEAGWVEGAFQAGYLTGVPLLVTLTDRVDARRIYLGSMLLGAAASFGFAVLAEGLWSACLLRALAGIGLAGTYMPGLKLLSDRIEGPTQSRAVSFYTASFSVGASLSVLMAGMVAPELGWRWAFAIPGLCATAAVLPVALAVPPARGAPRPQETGLLDFRPVLRNRRAIAYSLGYAAHMWELFGFRAWLVAFLLFSQTGSLAPGVGSGATTLAAAILLLGLPASVLGNEASLRFGRRRTLIVVMAASAALALGVGFSAALPFVLSAVLCALYGVTVAADSASLTAGAVGAAAPAYRGATMAVHTLIGFFAATLSPLVFGAVLDLGGDTRVLSWGLAFAVLGAGVAAGPLVLWLLRPGRGARS